jgi:hypothetical protein
LTHDPLDFLPIYCFSGEYLPVLLSHELLGPLMPEQPHYKKNESDWDSKSPIDPEFLRNDACGVARLEVKERRAKD